MERLITSYNLLLQDDGRVYYADNIVSSSRPNSYEQRMRLGVYDFSNDSFDLYEQDASSGYGRSASLVRGSGLHSQHIYVGGNFDETSSEHWHLAFMRVDPDVLESAHISILVY